jgi:dienelactone hydrolase
MRLFTLLVSFLAAFSTSVSNLSAQSVGHTTITFNDAARTGGFGSGGGAGRQIQTELYYNAAAPGVDVPLVQVGASPAHLIVFGHGFLMGWDSYQWLWDSLCSAGYVIALPRTEGGFAPNHADFGKDLFQLANKVTSLNTDNTSLFYQKLSGKTALGGHSMGGGCSFMAASAGASDITCLFNFAAAETSNSGASIAAKTIVLPTLVFAGGNDCVAPPVSHAKLIYDSLQKASCKYYVEIIDGMHCQFNNVNVTCSAGQIACPTSPLSREQQFAKVLRHLRPFLRHHLAADVNALATFDDTFNDATDIVKARNCMPTGLSLFVSADGLVPYPNPATDVIIMPREGAVRMVNMYGTVVLTFDASKSRQIEVSSLPRGVYWLQCEKSNTRILLQ